MTGEEIIRLSPAKGEYIEGVLAYPERLESDRAVLLCSPHPHFAGNMDNNVIRALYMFLSGRGLPVLRFNYRGVGGSILRLPEDESLFGYWNNVEERKEYDRTLEDTSVCLGYLASFDPCLRITMIGYSFGAIMAMLVGLNSAEVERVICIAPPLTEYNFLSMGASGKRIYMIGSSGDFVYRRDDFFTFCNTMKWVDDHAFFESCDHFFRGREDDLSRMVWDFMMGGGR